MVTESDTESPQQLVTALNGLVRYICSLELRAI